MSDLALRLKVFIASPGDVADERDVAEAELLALGQEAAADQLLVQPFRWEHAGPYFERPQGPLSRELQQSELTIAILWTRLGSAATFVEEPVAPLETGFEEEFRIGGDLVRSGRADDLLLYWRTEPAPATADPEQLKSLMSFKQRLEQRKTLLFSGYDSVATFQKRLRQDLRRWLRRWVGVPEICKFALEHSIPADHDDAALGENALNRLRGILDERLLRDHVAAVGEAAVRIYQAVGPSHFSQPFELAAPAARAVDGLPRQPDHHPFVREGARYRFSHPEWFYLFCAHGLVDAIRGGKLSAISRIPYVNPVHQLFRALQPAQEIVSRLREWLVNNDGVTAGEPIVRNFAAYELGMLGVVDAQDDLAYALENDRGTDVQTYCITSLGKLRARRHLPLLVKWFFKASDEQTRLLVTQAVCRMVGVSNYEL